MGGEERERTYRDKNAVRVLGLAGLVCAHEVGQALDVVDAHHVDVVIEAESLDEGEVNLQGDVALVLLVGGEDAECHAVRITVERRRKEVVRPYALQGSCVKRKMMRKIVTNKSRIAILTHS